MELDVAKIRNPWSLEKFNSDNDAYLFTGAIAVKRINELVEVRVVG